MSSNEDLASACAAAIHDHLFALLDRDQSGHADEADVVAALQCQLGSFEKATQALARVSEEGHVDPPKLRALLESSVPPSAHSSELQRHEQVMRLILAIVRDFERRATARGEFELAGKARACGKEIRATEERRSLFVLMRQHEEERVFLGRSQKEEAKDFNRSWKNRMEEFSKLAAHAIEEMHEKHKNAVAAYIETNRPLLVHHFKLHAKDKDLLDAKRVLKRLAISGDFDTCERYRKHVEGQEQKDSDAAVAKAEGELAKKVEVQRWHQRLELKALMTKCERIRSEHRSQWEDGLARLVLTQKNMIAECDARHARESKRAHVAIRATLEPSLKPTARIATHQNFSLLSPRRVRALHAASSHSRMSLPSFLQLHALPDSPTPFMLCIANRTRTAEVSACTTSRRARLFYSRHRCSGRAGWSPQLTCPSVHAVATLRMPADSAPLHPPLRIRSSRRGHSQASTCLAVLLLHRAL